MSEMWNVGELVAVAGYGTDDIPVTILQGCPAGIGQSVIVQFNADDDARDILAGEIHQVDAFIIVPRAEFTARPAMRTPKVILRMASGEARRAQLAAIRARDEQG